MKIVFMGTPDFSVPVLISLAKNHEVKCVITQPDKRCGRGQKLQAPPVKETAVKLNIPVYQPQRLKKNQECIDLINDIKPDAIVVVAFGQILPPEILHIPRYGCINVHASLLPDLRGAAPINWAVIKGYKKTGITIMKMDEGVDTGDIFLTKEVEIGDDETAGELFDKLSKVGPELLLTTLDKIENGQIEPIKQDNSKSNYAPMMNKELGKICWDKDCREVYNLIRGVTPWPGAYTVYNGKIIKIWEASVIDNISCDTPGKIIKIDNSEIIVSCRLGAVGIKKVQEQGGKKLDVASYINGHSININEVFE